MAEISVSLYKPRSLVGKEMYHRLLDDYPERFINLAVDLWLESVGLTNSPGLRYSVRAKLIRHFTKNEPYWFKSGDLNGNLVVLRLRP